MSWFGDAGGFLRGAGEGAWDGAKGTVQGVGQLAHDGYKLATDGQYRQQAWDAAVHDAKAVGNFAATAVTDPGKAATEVGHAASGAWHAVHTAYDQAAAQGQGSEFFGKLFGQGAILVGTAFVPGGAEADAAGAIGDAGRATELISDAGKATEFAGDAGKASEFASKGADATGDAGRLTNAATHAEGDIDLGSTAQDAEIGAPPVVHLEDADAFKAAAEHAAPNTKYEFGSYSWTTDARGRTVQAEGEVELTPAGRDTGFAGADRQGGRAERCRVPPDWRSVQRTHQSAERRSRQRQAARRRAAQSESGRLQAVRESGRPTGVRPAQHGRTPHSAAV